MFGFTIKCQPFNSSIVSKNFREFFNWSFELIDILFICSVLADGRSKCDVCNKIFNKPSQLKLHVNIHYFEQPFRCESCAVSFRTKGHLQKHLGSNSHLNKVSVIRVLFLRRWKCTYYLVVSKPATFVKKICYI